MSADLPAVIAATAQWLLLAYPPVGGVVDRTLAEAQARQAVTVAAWLRYPTALDASLLSVVGPGGSGHLDWTVGAETDQDPGWRAGVDEVVASWAACLLADCALATEAVAAVRDSEHLFGLPFDFRRLTEPDDHDRQAAVLLRHPDLTASVTELHAPQLHDLLRRSSADAA